MPMNKGWMDAYYESMRDVTLRRDIIFGYFGVYYDKHGPYRADGLGEMIVYRVHPLVVLHFSSLQGDQEAKELLEQLKKISAHSST